ncbi:hypothetical protein OG213_49800 [Streptomyces mirabilis]
MSEAVDVVRIAVAHAVELTRAVDLEHHLERRFGDETAVAVGHFDKHVRVTGRPGSTSQGRLANSSK